MQTRIEEIRAAGGEVVAISVDPPDKSNELVEAYGLSFDLLSDPQAEVVEAYGVLHPDGGLDGDIARPATFLIDRDGRVAWFDLTENWRIRPRPDEILSHLGEIP